MVDPDGYQMYTSTGVYSIYPTQDQDGQTWTVTSEKLVYDGAVTITVDDASKVTAALSGSSNNILKLQNGENVVKYTSKYDQYLLIQDSRNLLYSVTVDGEPAKFDYGYRIELKDVKNIDIKANYPDKDCTVKFTFTNPGTEGFITYVGANGQAINLESIASFTVKAGQTLSYTGNTSEYNVIEYSRGEGYNGYFSGSDEFVVKDDITINFNVTKIARVKATINLTGKPEWISASLNYNTLELKEGENSVEFLSSECGFNVSAKDGYYLSEYTIDGENALGSYGISLKENSVVNITVKEIVRDMRCAVYRNIGQSDITYSLFSNNDGTFRSDLQQGYTVVPFCQNDLPLGYASYTQEQEPTLVAAYLNDEPQTQLTDNQYKYTFQPKNGDVIRIYYGTEAPAKQTITFINELGYALEIGKDIINKYSIAKGTSEVEFLPGTRLEIPTGNYTILIDDAPVATNDTILTHNVSQSASIKIASQNSGVLGLQNETVNAPVYNIQGIAVSKVADFNNLPAGVYIVNGKKVVKK